MIDTPRPSYQDRVRTAAAELQAFHASVQADLDEEQGGIGWWSGHTDWKRLVLLSDYLLDSLDGTAQSLVQAALAADAHREQQNSDDNWLKAQWRTLGKGLPPTLESFFKVTARNPHEHRRELLIKLYAEHCFYSLAQALDRLAAAVAIAAAFKNLSVLDMDWNNLQSTQNAVRDRQKSKYLEEPGTPGRALQDELIKVSMAYEDFGPTDWLPWLLRARNTNTHRAPKLAAHLLRNERRGRGVGGILRPFYRQPGWDDMEALAAGADMDGENSLWLLKETTTTLDGLVDSTVELTTAMTKTLTSTWVQRRDQPSVLIQHGSQWPTLMARPQLRFPGYGDDVDVSVETGTMYLSAAMGRRLRAAKVLDSVRHRWSS